MKNIIFILALVFSIYSCKDTKNNSTAEVAVNQEEEQALVQLRKKKEAFHEEKDADKKREMAETLLEDYKTFTTNHPKAKALPKILLNMAEIYEKEFEQYEEAFGLYNEIYTNHPESEVAPHALLLQGIIVQQYFGDEGKAEEMYILFLSKYPDHLLVNMVNELMSQLGKEPDSLYQEILQKQKSAN